MSKIKSFRGLIADKTQDTITLHTNDGSMGYKIKKFEIISYYPVNDNTEHIMQIWKVPRSSTDVAAGVNTVDFSNPILLGVGIYTSNTQAFNVASFTTVIFDNEIFNQDIYITHSDEQTGNGANYYLELEQVKLDLDENTVATLKDIRNITQDV